VAVTGVAFGEPVALLVPCGGMRSAPNVAAGGTTAAFSNRSDVPVRELAKAAVPAALDMRRMIVAGLLMAAAIALVGGAVLGRRGSPDPDAPIDAGDPSDATEVAPPLTLVPMPRESGP